MASKRVFVVDSSDVHRTKKIKLEINESGNLPTDEIKTAFNKCSSDVVSLLYEDDPENQVYVALRENELKDEFFPPEGGWNENALHIVNFDQPCVELEPKKSSPTKEMLEEMINRQKDLAEIQEATAVKQVAAIKRIEKIEAAQADREFVHHTSLTYSGTQFYQAQLEHGLLKVQEAGGAINTDPFLLNELYQTQRDRELHKLQRDWESLVKKTSKLSENRHQHPLFYDLVSHLKPIDLDVLNDEAYFINRQRPDFIFNQKNSPHIASYCWFVAELQLGAHVDTNHKSRVMQYNFMILEANPRRERVLSFATNLKDMVFIESKRVDNLITHFEYLPIDFWSEGVNRLNQMIHDPLCVGYDDSYPIINFQIPSDPAVGNYYLSRFVGHGHTACVYKFRRYNNQDHVFDRSKNYVAKVFRTEQQFQEEVEIMQEIQSRLSNAAQNFISLVHIHQGYKTIVYEPFGEPLTKLTKDRVAQMFGCLGALQTYGVIHRDLSPSHFLKKVVDDQEVVFIIDFGCAYLAPQKGSITNMNESNNDKDVKMTNYKGSIQFAALEILEDLRGSKFEYQPHRRHDAESLIRTIMYLYHQLILPNEVCQAKRPLDEIIKLTLVYWQIVDQYVNEQTGSFWKEALEMARSKAPTTIESFIRKFDELKYDFVSNSEILSKFAQTLEEN